MRKYFKAKCDNLEKETLVNSHLTAEEMVEFLNRYLEVLHPNTEEERFHIKFTMNQILKRNDNELFHKLFTESNSLTHEEKGELLKFAFKDIPKPTIINREASQISSTQSEPDLSIMR